MKTITIYDTITVSMEGLDNAFSESRWDTPSEVIGRLVEEHDYNTVYNTETGEYDSIPTGNPYRKCEGCSICNKVDAEYSKSAIFSIARTRARGFAKFDLGHIGKFHEMGLSLSDMASVMDCRESRILAEINKVIEEYGALYAYNYLNLWEVSEKTFLEWTGLTTNQLRRERYTAKTLKRGI